MFRLLKIFSTIILQEEIVSAQLLLLVKLGLVLVDTGTVRIGIATEGDVQVLQEAVAASKQGFRLVGTGLDGWLTIKDDNTVCEVRGHDEIVLDDKGGLLGVHDEALDDTRGNNTLFGVEVRTGLVDEVDVGRDTKGQYNGNTLQFTTREVLHFLVNKVVHLERLVDVSLELWVQKGGLDLLEEELSDGTLELGGDGLRLHTDAHLGNLGVTIRLQSTSKHLTEGRLSSTIFTHHDKNLGIGKGTRLNVELEVTQGLLHAGV